MNLRFIKVRIGVRLVGCLKRLFIFDIYISSFVTIEWKDKSKLDFNVFFFFF